MKQEQSLDKLQGFEQFYTTLEANIPVLEFLVNLFLTALMAYILNKLYVRYGKSLSNRKAFAENFLLIGLTTMIIITIVKSSLALSLGLVGALSIVRFRVAIKEPEELSYIFLTIALGLGFGANQRLITIVGFISVIVFLALYKKMTRSKMESENLILTVSTDSSGKVSSDQIIDLVKENTSSANLKRLEENRDLTEISFLVEYASIEDFRKGKAALKNLDESLTISYIDNKGLI